MSDTQTNTIGAPAPMRNHTGDSPERQLTPPPPTAPRWPVCSSTEWDTSEWLEAGDAE